MIWQARHFRFTFPPTLIMGILNVTPDSFSDGGRYYNSTEVAVNNGLTLIDQGANILDIGGESTRPGAQPVSEAEELRRVMPVIEKLAPQLRIPISIDTTKPAVARAALNAGASIVNDVFAGLHPDFAMWELVAETGAGYVLMHSQGTPITMQVHPEYQAIVSEINDFFGAHLQLLSAHGVKLEQVALDVGIGFGKGLEHNLQLLGSWSHFRKWKHPLVLGASRKSFLGRLTGSASDARLAPSLACACWGLAQGAEIIRCHDVAETRQAAQVFAALQERQKDAKYS